MDKKDVGLVILVVLGIQLFVFPFMIEWLWNIIVVPVCGVGLITYWQAFGLKILVELLAAVKGKSD